MEELLSATQVARLLHLSDRIVRGYIRDGKVHAVKVSKTQYGISWEEVQRLASEKRIEIEIPDTLAGLRAEVHALREEVQDLRQAAQLHRDELARLREKVTDLENRPATRPARVERVPAPAQELATESHVTETPRLASSAAGDTVAARAFAEEHGINGRTMIDYIGGKRFGDKIDAVVIGRAGPHLQYGLTPAQQAGAIAFFQRNGIAYTPCHLCPHNARSL